MAAGHRVPVYVCFVDLRKAYDSVDRGKLFSALMLELGVSDGLVAALRRMYTDVRA